MNSSESAAKPLAMVRALLRGAGQVMFQCNAWTGLLFLAGIFWGAYECHSPQMAWGAVVGLIVSTAAGLAVGEPESDGEQGLWGFNGILVGAAFPAFLPNTWLTWLCLIFFAAASTWVRRGFNNSMASWHINSLTFPFVLLTWAMLLASRMLGTMQPDDALSVPGLQIATEAFDLTDGFWSLVKYWLKGVSQVFLLDSWITGIIFLVGLAIGNKWAAIYAALASAIALGLAILMHANSSDIASGLYGFSPVLTGIAIGMTFYSVNWRSCLWAIAAIVATFFVQVAMDILLEPWGMPTLTGPFCVATWLFWLPQYKFSKQNQ